MPDIAGLLKVEIARLSKKVVREQTKALQSASSQYRHQIAALKKDVAQLQRQIAQLRKSAARGAPVAESAEQPRNRFVAKGLKSMRERLDLSARDLGLLLDVSTQTIYNWETKKTSPRADQVAAIAALRGLGKKAIRARLASMEPGAPEA